MERLIDKLLEFAAEHKTVCVIIVIIVFGLAYACDMILANYMGITSAYGYGGMPIQ